MNYDNDINDTTVGNEYFYIRNLKNDVIALSDIYGNIVVEYTYDAYGNIIYQTDSDIAKKNSYRYRGYRYKEETGWFGINTRYEDSVYTGYYVIDKKCSRIYK